MPPRRSSSTRSGSAWRRWRPGEPTGVADAPRDAARGAGGHCATSLAAAVLAPARATVRVLGLDPGSQNTGFGVVECGPAGTTYVASGTIVATKKVTARKAGTKTAAHGNAAADGGPADAFATRLQTIYAAVAALVAEHRPDEIAIERVFVHRNPDSALKLGQARGAALCATFGSGATLHEYSPREVKLAVVGTGAAEKEQVQRMVKALLGLEGRLGADAADALAIAICHAHGRAMAAATLLARSTPARGRAAVRSAE
jgi:crossover junction endodeoxyribonuclease RuvC